jgi:hypothetical protein
MQYWHMLQCQWPARTINTWFGAFGCTNQAYLMTDQCSVGFWEQLGLFDREEKWNDGTGAIII